MGARRIREDRLRWPPVEDHHPRERDGNPPQGTSFLPGLLHELTVKLSGCRDEDRGQPDPAYQRTLRSAYRGGMSDDEKTADAASEDMKRKFREALEKKNAQSRKGEAHLDGDSAVHGTHGAVTKREFRRKSG